MTQQKDFTGEEFKVIQSESHQFHKSYEEIMGDFEEKENRLNEQSIGLFTTLLTSVGVIAGFGFTALGNVINRALFFTGESLLLFLIVFGLFILFSYNKSREKRLREVGDKYHDLLSPRLDLYKNFLTFKITKKELYEKLNTDDKKVFNFKIDNNAKILDLHEHLRNALIILIIGIIFLITSFINFNFSNKCPGKSGIYHARLDNCISIFHAKYNGYFER